MIIHSSTFEEMAALRMLLSLLALPIGLASGRNWQPGELVEFLATECNACLLVKEIATRESFAIQKVDSFVHDRCDSVPAAFSSVCLRSTHHLLTALRLNLQDLTKDCSNVCSSPSPLGKRSFCFLLLAASNGLSNTFESLSSSLLPQICSGESDPFRCSQKNGGLIQIVENAIGRFIRKAAVALDSEDFCGIAVPDKEKLEPSEDAFTIEKMQCQACFSFFDITQQILTMEETEADGEDILKTFVERFCEENSVSECDSVKNSAAHLLRLPDSQVLLCKMAFNCEKPAEKSEEKGESL